MPSECGPSTRCCSFLSAPLLHHRLAGPLALGGAGARPLPCKLRVAEHHLRPKTGSYSYFVGSWPVHFIACVIPQGASPPYFDRQFCRRFVLSWIYICCWKSELNNESLRALKGVLVAHMKMRKQGKASLIGIPCKKYYFFYFERPKPFGWVGGGHCLRQSPKKELTINKQQNKCKKLKLKLRKD